MRKAEVLRYIINGLTATAVHYGVLNFNLLVLGFESAGMANMVAACFGITASFLGSRYYVYRGHTNSLSSQVVRFGLLYTFIALLHGAILYIWTDIYELNYHIGFVIATFVQMSFSYFGNKVLVFKNEN
ncbi:MAG: GtrA family protein [Sulfuricurvum sp.]|nr:GtrA family protein [Sulfuricurvum sp.]